MAGADIEFASCSTGDTIVEALADIHSHLIEHSVLIGESFYTAGIAVVKISRDFVRNHISGLRSEVYKSLESASTEVDMCEKRYFYICQYAVILEVCTLEVFAPSALTEVKFGDKSEILLL